MTVTPTTPNRIYMTETLANGLHSIIKIAADRGAFKLEEYGAVATVMAEFEQVVQNSKLPPVARPDEDKE